MHRLFLLFLWSVLIAVPSLAEPREDQLEAHIRFLADDLCQGRALGSQGLELANLYLESQYRRLGLRPGFGDSYRQPFTLVGSKPDPQPKLIFQARGTELRPTYREQFVAFSSRLDAASKVQGELVYAGYEIQAPEREWDDIKGVDLKGKILLVEVNEPGNQPGGIFEGTQMTYYGRWTYKYEKAAELGAAGVLLVHNPKRATYGWDVVRNSWTTEGFFIPEQTHSAQFEGWLNEETVKKICQMGGHDYGQLLQSAEGPQFKPQPLGVTVTLEHQPVYREVSSANVGAWLPGTAPEKNPFVVVTAHQDHLGVDGKGGVYNGLVDNVSACASMLTLAEDLANREPLPLNVLFVAVTAEEQGLWGSRFLAGNLPVDPGRVWANINLEMTNIWGPSPDLYAIGSGQSNLDQLCRVAANKIGAEYI